MYFHDAMQILDVGSALCAVYTEKESKMTGSSEQIPSLVTWTWDKAVGLILSLRLGSGEVDKCSVP